MDFAYKITVFISFLALITAFALSIVNREKKDLFQIKLYILISIVVTIIDIFCLLAENNISRKIEPAALNIASLFEISLIYNFLFIRIKGSNFRVSIIIFFIIYLSTCTLIWTINKSSIFSFIPVLFGIEGLLITIPCLFYIYEILKSDLHIDIKSDSNFVVTCGILFYFSVSTPIFFSWYTLYYLSPGFNQILIMSNIICYIILIISFMKAYLCPIPDQPQ
jgi:hypothetical protein